MNLNWMAVAAAIVSVVTAASPGAPAFAQEASADRQINVRLLPISLHRIQREIRQSSETSSQEGLRLRYQVDVYGRAPAIELFTAADNLRHGPVPYGAPTHQEMLRMMTPEEFRAPAADFSALMRWLADRASQK